MIDGPFPHGLGAVMPGRPFEAFLTPSDIEELRRQMAPRSVERLPGTGLTPEAIDAARKKAEDKVFEGTSDGSTASYYELPPGAAQLQDLISYRNMNAQDGEMFRALYRKGRASHSDALRDAKKILFYAQAEVDRLLKYGEGA
jgi:hypothetical protein